MRNLSATSERLVTNGVAATQYTQAIVRQSHRSSAPPASTRSCAGQRCCRCSSRTATCSARRSTASRTAGDPDRADVIDRMRTNSASIERGLTSPRAPTTTKRSAVHAARERRGPAVDTREQQTDRELSLLRDERAGAPTHPVADRGTRARDDRPDAAVHNVLGRPIRKIDAAISNIGHGRLDEPVDVHGPTDLQALGRQLEWLRVRLGEISEERNRFLRHMSHELKTPLANIREGTELMLEGAVAGSTTSNGKSPASCARTACGCSG